MEIQKKSQINALSNVLLAVALGAGVATYFGNAQDHKAFASGYLVAYIFWIGVTLGGFALTMIHNLTAGNWGLATRNIMDRCLKNIPLMAILIIPILMNVHELYHWSHADAISHDAILQHKAAYLNVPFFIGRVVAYFVIWTMLAFFLNRWHQEYDTTLEPKALSKLQGLSGAGLIVYAFTVSFFVFDLIMSLEPHWFSTIFGVIYMVSFALSTLAFSIVMGVRFSKAGLTQNIYTPKRHYDLGNLLFGFNMVWIYVALSQFLIIWSGNLQEETPWYLVRTAGGWGVLILIIVALHGVVPFLALLLRKVKQCMTGLCVMATLILVMRVVDLYWQIKPALYEQPQFHWVDLSSLVFMSALWIALFLRTSANGPLVCQRDKELNQE